MTADDFGTLELPEWGDIFGSDEPEEPEIEEEEEGQVRVYKRSAKHIHRRLKSEAALEDAMDWHYQPGDCFHCISFGDVDSLTYLRHIAKQQRIEYAIISTWCMGAADIVELDGYLTRGIIGRIDFYVGEIFGGKGRYSEEWTMLTALMQKHGGRAALFRNHSKVMVGFGERFDFTIEPSANVNTNPRCENTVITVDTDLARFYKEFFDAIRSFDRTFDAWKPYEIGER